jgi:hypothetical protein
VVDATPRSLCLQGKRPGKHCTGCWAGPRAGLDGWWKSLPHRVAIPTELVTSAVQEPAVSTSHRSIHIWKNYRYLERYLFQKLSKTVNKTQFGRSEQESLHTDPSDTHSQWNGQGNSRVLYSPKFRVDRKALNPEVAAGSAKPHYRYTKCLYKNWPKPATRCSVSAEGIHMSNWRRNNAQTAKTVSKQGDRQ